MYSHHTKIRIIITVSSLFLLSFRGAAAQTATEARIREYFWDIPAMVAIAKCETNFTQYTAGGTAYYNATRTYIGAFQIAEKIHSSRAKSMGYNIATLEGNMKYARYLYINQGTAPWKRCALKSTPLASPVKTITLNLSMGMANSEVLLLQKLLNSLGFTVSPSGPGSPGNETSRFGTMTKSAVQRFQCEKNIICAGDDMTTGYGKIGPRTRTALNLAASQR